MLLSEFLFQNHNLHMPWGQYRFSVLFHIFYLAEISITSDMQMTPPLWQKVKRN